MVNDRQALRETYKRSYLNPFRGSNAIIDPAILRYESARAYMKDSLKIAPKTILAPVIFFALVIATQKYINNSKDERNAKIQSGELTYFRRALYWAKYTT